MGYTNGVKIIALSMYSINYKYKKLLINLENMLDKIEDKTLPYEFIVMVSVFFRLARDIYNLKVRGLRAILKSSLFLVSVLFYDIKAARAEKLSLAKQLGEISPTQCKLDENIIRFSL